MSNKVEPVELCVMLPYQDFVIMDKRAKKGETAEAYCFDPFLKRKSKCILCTMHISLLKL